MIPVIPIGFDEYKKSIKALICAVPLDRHSFEQVKSPIDELRTRHNAACSQENRIMSQIARIRSEIFRVDGEMRAL